MAKLELTSARCRSLECPPGKKKEVYRCTKRTGLGVETRESGKATYWFYYTAPPRRAVQIKIGGVEDITFEAAVRRWSELRSQTVLGGDPAAEKAERKAIPTYGEIARQHMAHNATYQKTPHNTDRIIRCHLLPRWGKLRLTEITSQSIALWLAEKRKGLAPATVEKIRVTMNRSFELAAEWNIPGASPNPVRTVKRIRFNNRRDKYLTAEEANRLLSECDDSRCKQLGSIVRLLLFTGARKMELLRAKWSDIDLERRAWHIPETKTGVPRYVPLSSAAIAVIDSLRRWDRCPWLIPNPETREPYTDLKRPWDTARDKAGLPELRIHDLRHSAASFLVNSGVDLYAVGKILGHADHQSTMRYAHLANDTLMSAVEAGAAKMQLT